MIMSREKIINKVNTVFRPANPIDNLDFLVGRKEELDLICGDLLLPGRFIVIYGARGIGKTSLINMAGQEFCRKHKYKAAYHSCSHKDNFEDVFLDLFKDARLLMEPLERKNKIEAGFGSSISAFFAKLKGELKASEEKTYTRKIKSRLLPNMIAKNFQKKRWLYIIDDYDRIENEDISVTLMETFKSLSNINSPLKVIVVGTSVVAADLIKYHESSTSNLNEVEILSMEDFELRQVILDGTQALKLKFEESVVDEIISVSIGLPYFTHLICEQLSIAALQKEIETISDDSFYAIIKLVIQHINPIIRNHYTMATEETMPSYISNSEFINMGKITSESQFREFIILLFSILNIESEEDLRDIIRVVDFLCKGGHLELRDGSPYEEIDVLVALDEICMLSAIMVRNKQFYQFGSPFHKAFVRLNAIDQFQGICQGNYKNIFAVANNQGI